MNENSLPPEVGWAVEAAQEKKATAITVLDLAGLAAFTDCFLLCNGASTRQTQVISDAIEERLGRRGVAPRHCEGYDHAEWILLDYGGFVVHIFHERARLFYDLERLWRAARRVDLPDSDAREGVAR